VKKIISISLFALLTYHALAYMLLVVAASWWRAENDLSERLLVYRSVDSIIEFEIPLKDKQEIHNITQATTDGFTYHGQYYSIISMEVQGNLLHIACLESESCSFWPNDLLAFLNKHIAGESNQKANQFLKFLLKEYSPTPRIAILFPASHKCKSVQIPEAPFGFSTRTLPVYSPPPES